MSLGDTLVIDAVAHAVDNSPEARNGNRYARAVVDGNFAWQASLIPDEYVLEQERYFAKVPPEMLLSALFLESQTDIACFHSIAMRGIFKDYSPVEVGLEIRDRYPHRMLVYGAVSPFDGVEATLEDIERQVEEWDIDGIKLYPLDLVDGKLHSYSLADEELLYPIFQKCLDLGVKVVGVHKAVPLGITPMDPFRVGDVDYAAQDFPDLAFEIVHAGLAFLDESALQMARFPNVWVNMEVTSQYGIKHKEKFARIMGEFLLAGGADKLIWSTGCSFTHPRPVIEAFADFRMPPELVEGGYPELTEEAKGNIFGRNFARMHGLDLDDIRAKIAADDIEAEKIANGLKAPWSEAKVPVPA
jgi:predicted TIM-barrel fold metal-dependent hydrolase